jgi:hypothetical protein
MNWGDYEGDVINRMPSDKPRRVHMLMTGVS